VAAIALRITQSTSKEVVMPGLVPGIHVFARCF
jgi:hypothetical protein